MDSKSKVLVQNSELSNLYEDIAKDILKNLVFDSSHENQVNQLLFISMLENALSHLADDTLDLFKKPKDEISKLNYIYKWNSLKKHESIKNIVEKELKSDGLLSIVEDAKEKLFKEVETNLILFPPKAVNILNSPIQIQPKKLKTFLQKVFNYFSEFLDF